MFMYILEYRTSGVIRCPIHISFSHQEKIVSFFIFYFKYMYNRLWIFISQINDSIRPRTVIVTVALLSGTLFFFLIWTVIGICQMFNGPFSYLRVVGKIWTVTEGCNFVLLSITLLSFCKHYFHGPDIKNFTMINISGINYMKETQLLHSSMMH